MKPSKTTQPRPTGDALDAALAATALGEAPTSDDAAGLGGEERLETDAIGAAAGVAVAEGEPLGGPEAIDRRDAHRWELDPASADEAPAVDEVAARRPPAPPITPRPRSQP